MCAPMSMGCLLCETATIRIILTVGACPIEHNRPLKQKIKNLKTFAVLIYCFQMSMATHLSEALIKIIISA